MDILLNDSNFQSIIKTITASYIEEYNNETDFRDYLICMVFGNSAYTIANEINSVRSLKPTKAELDECYSEILKRTKDNTLEHLNLRNTLEIIRERDRIRDEIEKF